MKETEKSSKKSRRRKTEPKMMMMMAKVAAATGYVATARWTHNKESNSTQQVPNTTSESARMSRLRFVLLSSSSPPSRLHQRPNITLCEQVPSSRHSLDSLAFKRKRNKVLDGWAGRRTVETRVFNESQAESERKLLPQSFLDSLASPPPSGFLFNCNCICNCSR